MSSAAFLAGAALLVQGEWGWTCDAPVTLGDYKGWVSREYESWKEHPSPYLMKIERPGPGDRHEIHWTVDPRPERVSDAFRAGPDMVGIDFYWGPWAVAPVRAHYWGDGVYAGDQLLASAGMLERRIATNTSPFGAESGAGPRPLLRKLAPARVWTVVVADGAGTLRSSETFAVPAWQEAEAAFREARARIDAMEQSYRALDPLPQSDASCTAHEDPAGIVLSD